MKNCICLLLAITAVSFSFCTLNAGEEDEDIEKLLGGPLSRLGGFKIEGDGIAIETIDYGGLTQFRLTGTAQITRSGGGGGHRNLYKNWENDEIKLAVSIAGAEFSLNFERIKDNPLKLEVKVSEGVISFMLMDKANEKNITFKQDAEGAVTVTTGTGSGTKGYSAESFSDFQRKHPTAYRAVAKALKRCTLVKPGGGFESYTDKVGLEAGECLAVLADGSRVKGRIGVKEWILETAYGKLTIPSGEITEILLGQTLSGGDEVSTIQFAVPGVLKFEKLVIEAKAGTLTIPKSDIVEIHFPHPRIEKAFELKPGAEWLNTGIVAKKHDKLEIKIETLGEGVKLTCRIAGEKFDASSGLSQSVEKEGLIYLRIEAGENIKEMTGNYTITVILQK